MDGVPIEIILNVFLSLERNEIEKCQLINRQWRNIVNAYAQELPIRVISYLEVGYAFFNGLRAYKDEDVVSIRFSINSGDGLTNLTEMEEDDPVNYLRHIALFRTTPIRHMFIQNLCQNSMNELEKFMDGKSF